MFTRSAKLILSAHTQQAHLLTAGRGCIPQLMHLPTKTGIFADAAGCEFYQHSSGGQQKGCFSSQACLISRISRVVHVLTQEGTCVGEPRLPAGEVA
jgi:hypothetical protein